MKKEIEQKFNQLFEYLKTLDELQLNSKINDIITEFDELISNPDVSKSIIISLIYFLVLQKGQIDNFRKMIINQDKMISSLDK
jgi:hypothetical protein